MVLVRSVPNNKVILAFLNLGNRIGCITLNGANLRKIKNKIISKLIILSKLKISRYKTITFHIEGNPI